MNRCIICGREVPEDMQICPTCATDIDELNAALEKIREVLWSMAEALQEAIAAWSKELAPMPTEELLEELAELAFSEICERKPRPNTPYKPKCKMVIFDRRPMRKRCRSNC